MPGNVISTTLIEKLGHKIEEIRIRALSSIISKLDYGFLYECDLSRSKELLIKLFEWFTFEPCIEQDAVLRLIQRILKSESGVHLIKHIGAEVVISDLKQIRGCIQGQYFPVLEQIMMFVNNANEVMEPLVPPLDLTSIPRTYRSESAHNTASSNQPGTTATTFDVFVAQGIGTPEVEHGAPPKSFRTQDSDLSSRPQSKAEIFDLCVPHSLLGWQPLVAPDRHVLASIESSLENPTDPAMLLHSCRFFIDVLLQDFPAEIFLQRPAIVKLFHTLLNNNPSTKIGLAVVASLKKLTDQLAIRVQYYCDPSTHNFKQEKCIEMPVMVANSPTVFSSTRSSPHSRHDDMQRDYYSRAASEASENVTDTEDSVLLQLQQLTLPHFCIQTLYYTFVRIGAKPSSVRTSAVRLLTQEHVNGLLNLATSLVKLMQVCVRGDIWIYKSDAILLEVAHQLTLLLTKLADVLEHSRLLVLASDLNPTSRVTHLQLLALTRLLLSSIIPMDKADAILPQALKDTIASCLLDASLARLYPQLHEELYLYVKDNLNYLQGSSLSRYKDVNGICKAMSAAVKLLRKGSSSSCPDVFYVILEALPSLEYHRNMGIIRIFTEICVNKYPKWKVGENIKQLVEEITLTLLAHSEMEVKSAMYASCHMYVSNILGVDHVAKAGPGRPGDCLLFLWRSAILIEIICHGLSAENAQIQRHSEDIILYILKSKLLVAPEVWDQILVALIPSMPLLQCYADKATPLGRSIVKMVDPDIAHSIHLPSSEVLKGNLRLLFSNDSLARNEALSRLTWILTTEENSREKLPLLKSLQGPILNSICLFEKTIDLQRSKSPHTFYQIGSMVQVVELLSSSGVEPTIRKSAVTQIAAMLEDTILHAAFLEQGGLPLVFTIFRNSLNEKEYENYPDNVIPLVDILKNLSLHNPTVRQEIALKEDVYNLITRALFLFSGDDRLRQNAAQLLCLLLFNDFILTTAALNNNQISIVALIANRFLLPFSSRTHWRTSQNTRPSLSGFLMSDESAAASLRIHWNIAWFGGLTELLSWDKVPPPNVLTPEEIAEFNGDLRLTKYDLASLKYSSPVFCCRMFLKDIENASTHQAVIESTHGLAAYLSLRKHIMSVQIAEVDGNILHLPWEQAIGRFLHAPPSSTADTDLLTSILNFLRNYMKLFKKSEKPCWVTAILKDPNHCLPKLLQQTDESSSSTKNLHRELLLLITECASLEQRFLDIGMVKMIKDDRKQKLKKRPKNGTWVHVVQAIAENLKFSDAQHFYNLAFLDWLLCCLVQITASLGWSENLQFDIDPKDLRGTLVGCLTELVGAFHCGKGPAAATSLMGLSITRNAVLTMNHLLCEMQNLNKRGWERFWLCETDSADVHGSLQWLGTLWASRDVILRAATLQLLAGLASSQRGATEVVMGLRSSCSGGVWTGALSILLDHAEASAVREQAAILLTNMSSHHTPVSGSQRAALPLSHGPIIPDQMNITASEAVLMLLEEINFYTVVDSILPCLCIDRDLKQSTSTELCNWKLETSSGKSLDPNDELKPNDYMLVYTKKLQSAHSMDSDTIPSSRSRSDQLGDVSQVVVTPSLVKAIAWFITNLLNLDPESVVTELNNHGLIRNFFKCLVNVTVEIHDSRSLVLYMDVLEMCAAICTLLTKATANSSESRSTILHLKDCLNTLLSILNPNIYYTNVPHLLFLRNRLWSQIFKFLTTLLNCDDSESCYQDKGHYAITVALNECGHEPFLEALCESISTTSTDLQQSAISSLTSLLRLETQKIGSECDDEDAEPKLESTRSLQNVLDSVRSPRCGGTDIALAALNAENISPPNYITAAMDGHGQYAERNLRKRAVLRTSDEANVKPTHHHLTTTAFTDVDAKVDAFCYNKNVERRRAAATQAVSESDASELTDSEYRMAGAELCQMLIRLYNVHSLKNNYAEGTVLNSKGKTVVIAALTSLLCVSKEAKKAALHEGLLELIITQLRELHVRLSLESVEYLKRAADKKRVCPILNEISNLLKLLTNFLLGDERVKAEAVGFGLADMIHKLWIWFNVQPVLLIEALKMLCTFTTECNQACQSIPLTSSVAGVGPRKSPSNLSLLHCIVSLVNREMEHLSRSHDLTMLSLSFHLLQNCCQAQECRILLTKSNIYQSFNRLHPAITKRQKPWETVELLWLEFLETLTFHTEGQFSVAKSNDALELVMALTSSSRQSNKMTALAVLRNVTFCQSNRAKLLSSGEFLQILHTKLANGSTEEKCTCVTIIWSLAANSQKAKLVLKTSGLDARLQDVLKQWKLSETSLVPKEQLNNLQYIIEMLREGR